MDTWLYYYDEDMEIDDEEEENPLEVKDSKLRTSKEIYEENKMRDNCIVCGTTLVEKALLVGFVKVCPYQEMHGKKE